MVAVGFGGIEGEVPGGEAGAFVEEGVGLVVEDEGDGAGAFGGVAELVGEFEAGFEGGICGVGIGGAGVGGGGGRREDAGEGVEAHGGGGEHIHAGAGEFGVRGQGLAGGEEEWQKQERSAHGGIVRGSVKVKKSKRIKVVGGL